MMVVVADAILEPRRRSGGLNAPDESFGDQDAECVVHRLKRDGPDLGPHDLSHQVGGDVRLSGDRTEDSQPLGGDLDAALAKEIGRAGQDARVTQIFESLKYPVAPPAAVRETESVVPRGGPRIVQAKLREIARIGSLFRRRRRSLLLLSGLLLLAVQLHDVDALGRLAEEA